MKRTDITELFPDAPKETIDKIMSLNGADVNAKNNDGETPLDIAEKESMEDAVEILKEYQKKKQAAETIQD